MRDKLDELKAQEERIATMRVLLERAAACRCLDVTDCGRKLLKASRSGLLPFALILALMTAAQSWAQPVAPRVRSVRVTVLSTMLASRGIGECPSEIFGTNGVVNSSCPSMVKRLAPRARSRRRCLPAGSAMSADARRRYGLARSARMPVSMDLKGT